jgi:hypothetical protein
MEFVTFCNELLEEVNKCVEEKFGHSLERDVYWPEHSGYLFCPDAQEFAYGFESQDEIDFIKGKFNLSFRKFELTPHSHNWKDCGETYGLFYMKDAHMYDEEVLSFFSKTGIESVDKIFKTALVDFADEHYDNAADAERVLSEYAKMTIDDLLVVYADSFEVVKRYQSACHKYGCDYLIALTDDNPIVEDGEKDLYEAEDLYHDDNGLLRLRVC